MGTEVKTRTKEGNIAFISIKDSSDKEEVPSIKKDIVDKGKIVTDDDPDAPCSVFLGGDKAHSEDVSEYASNTNKKSNSTTLKDSKDNTVKVGSTEKKSVPKEEKKKGFVLTEEIVRKGLENLMKRDVVPLPKKTAMSYINGSSIRDLIKQVNSYNEFYHDYPILKDDIVSILKEGESYVLLFYRYSK